MGRPKRILIQGIGGIGGPLAAALIKAGYAVTLITNNEQITTSINADGIKIIKNNEEVRFFSVAHTSLEELPITAKYDIIFLIMKATSVMDAAKLSCNYIAKKGYFVSFQNGIVEDSLSEIVGEDRLVSAIIGYGGTMHEPGVYEKTSKGTIHIGELNGVKSRRIAELKTILQNVEDVVLTTNIRGVLWSKLAINCAVNSLGALTGQNLGDLLKMRTAREIFIRTYSEVIDLSRLEGIKLEKISVNPFLIYRERHTNFLKQFVKDLLIRFIGRRYKHTRSSTYQSLARGRKSEIDFLNGYVVDKAKDHNFPVPMNKQMVILVHKIEEGKLSIKPSNISLIQL